MRHVDESECDTYIPTAGSSDELYHNQHRSDGTDPTGSNAVYRTWFSLIQAA
jgi:hypothetical protein